MKKTNIPVFETLFIAVGEAVVSAIVIGIFALIRKFSYTVLTGAALGSALVVLNFLFLSIVVNRAIDRSMAERPEGELSDEELEEFTKKAAFGVQNAARLSYFVRMITMLAALVVAFVSSRFDVIATLVPFLALRPLIMVQEFFRKKAR